MKERARRELTKEWRESHRDEIAAARLAPAASELEGTRVERDGVRYVIHGIAHGQRSVAPLSTQLVAALVGFIRAFERPPASDYCTEGGMSRALGLPKDKELSYMRDIFAALGAVATIGYMLKVLVLIPLFPFALLASRLSRDPVMHVLRDAMRSLEGLARLRRIYPCTELPPRIAMPLAKGGERFRYEHSRALTRAMVAFANERRLSEVHLICGFAHEADVAMFLEDRTETHQS